MTRRRAVRIVAWSLAAGIVLALIQPLFFFALRARFNPAPPPHDFAAPANELEAQRQDITYFSRLMALDRSYSRSAREEANRRIASLLQQESTLDRGHFRVALMEIAALADNGHTLPFGGAAANTLPIRVMLFPDGLFVIQARPAVANLLGARVEAIEGRPVGEVLSALANLQGGLESWRQVFGVVYVTSPEILNGAGLAASAEQTTLTFRMPDGALADRRLAAESGGLEISARRLRWFSPEASATESGEWHAVVSDKTRLPISLREFGLGFRRFRLENSCMVFVQMKGIGNVGSTNINEFLRATEEDMRGNPPCALILDLRFNIGGNYANAYGFARSLPGLMALGGRVYILTSPRTLSAAIATTAFVKQAMGSRAVILGEPVGDRLAYWAEGNRGCLPHSKLCFAYATGKHDYVQGCWDWRECFWPNWFYPVRVDSLAPDETIAMSFADYKAGRDPVFERAVALASEAAP
ncbi:MAG: hypothetical protein ACRD8O_22210 [Bryobacteraceae bacterium]